MILNLVIVLGLFTNAVASESDRSIPKPLTPASLKSVSSWFSPGDENPAEIPATIRKLAPVEKDRVEAVREALWKAYAKSPLGQELKKSLPAPLILEGKDDPTKQPHELKTGEKIMPFYFVGKGSLEGKRPLFIALHGGGSAGGRAPSSHGWGVNTREWNTQARLAAGVYPTDALYFVPRMADDNDGRWYYHYCQDAYDKVVRAAILHHNVNPNRVYLIGISEGAYTAYRLGAFMADRWAGAGSMAGGEPLRNAPPENMRNIAFRADIGERDTMFDRVGLNRRYGEALEKLQKDDPDGFKYTINVQAGRSHGIDYKPCPQWISQYRRNPRPDRVTWTIIKVHGRRKEQFYWLAMDEDPPAEPIYIDARVDKKNHTINLTVEKDGKDGKRIPTNEVALRVYLDDDMLDLDKPVRIVRNGKLLSSRVAPRRVEVMMRSLAERGDLCYVFPAEITIPKDSDAYRPKENND